MLLLPLLLFFLSTFKVPLRFSHGGWSEEGGHFSIQAGQDLRTQVLDKDGEGSSGCTRKRPCLAALFRASERRLGRPGPQVSTQAYCAGKGAGSRQSSQAS